MNVPTGYTALDLVGFSDKGTYNSATAYVKNDIVHYGGNLWRCLVDDTTNVTPTEGANWTVFLAEPTSAAEDIIAQVETSSTSARSYAVGEQLIWNDTLYAVTAAITVGDTLTVGTNITASTTIVDQLAAKANSSALASVATSGSYNDLLNKPTIPAAQIQSDWNQSDNTATDFIKNKPSLGTVAEKNVPTSGDASSSEVVMGDDSRLTNARNAADVSAWAKAANKPTYNGAEILTSTAKTGTAQLSISDTVASGTSMDNVVGTMLNNDKTLDTNVYSINEALSNVGDVINNNGAKNLLPITFTSQTVNGTPMQVESNGTITVNGGPSTGGDPEFVELGSIDVTEYIGKSLTLSGAINGSNSTYELYFSFLDSSSAFLSGYNVFNDSANCTVPNNAAKLMCYFIKRTGQTYNTTLKPMVTLASQPNSDYAHYVPYAMTNRELTESQIKVVYESDNSASTAGNSSVFCDISSRLGSYYPTAIGVIPLGTVPIDTWDTICHIVGYDATNKRIVGRSIGSTTQQYSFNYIVLYR